MAIQRRYRVVQRAMQDLVHAKQRADLDVLELGCGFTGANLQLLNQQFPQSHYTGVDMSVAKELAYIPQIKLIEGDVESWRPEQSFDLVISMAVVEHLSRPRVHFALIANCLKPYGLAVLTTPTPFADFLLRAFARLGIFDPHEIFDHKAYLTESGIRSFCRQADLEIEDYHLASFGMNHAALLRKRIV